MSTYSLKGTSLQAEIEQKANVNLDTCMQCGCCTGGCSGIDLMDYSPRQMIQLIKMDERDILLKSKTIWMCLSCHICEDRCPAGIKISKFMDVLREISCSEGATEPNMQIQFHKLFLGQVRTFSRTHEGLLMMGYALKAKAPMPPTKLIIDLLRRMRVDMKPPHFPGKSYRLTMKKVKEGGKDNGA